MTFGLANKKTGLVLVGLFLFWAVMHLVIVGYGTRLVPLYSFYASSDEQAPILGVMHMLEAKSPFGMRGHDSVYYGPVFSLIAAPAVALDVIVAVMKLGTFSPEAYKLWFSFNWGSVLFFARWTAVLAGFLGLIFAWKLLSLPVINPSRKKWMPWLGVLLLGSNFYYFLYSGWLRQWIFMTAFLIVEIYFIIQIKERGKKSDWIWLLVFSALNFGITFFNSLIYQIVWLPVLIGWWRQKDWANLKKFVYYCLGLLLCSALILFWNYTPYLRVFELAKQPGLSFNPWAMPSLVYYLKMLFVNQPFLMAGFLLVSIFALQKKIHLEYWFWIFASCSLIHFLFFASNVHAEPRYILPVLAMVILTTTFLTARLEKGFYLKLAFVLLGLEIAWQSANSLLWMNAAAHGPEDKALIVWLSSLFNDKKVVLDPWRFLGVAHSKKIISDYAATRYGQGNIPNMFDYFSKTDPPAWAHPVSNFEYLLASDKTSGGTPLGNFDYFVYKTGEPLGTNFFEENLVRLWFLDSLRLKYFALSLK